jgi:hypothetical protein
VADRFAGLKGRCKKCQALFVMPVKSEVEIVLDEAAADAVSVEGDQTESPPIPGPTPPRRRKKKKRTAAKRRELSRGWWWGGLLIVVGICLATPLTMAACGYRLSAVTSALRLVFAVPFNTIIFALSLLISNYFGSGIELSDFKTLIPKSLILILLTSLVDLVPCAGFFFAIGIWFIGIMSFFELELMEAALIVAINFVLGFLTQLFLIGLLISSITVPPMAPTGGTPTVALSAPASGRP